MPWQPLPRIAFAVATYPFTTVGENELPLEIGDDLYIIEETPDGQWLRGYLLAPPSLLAGLTSVKGETLEARVFSGIFPRSCVEIREVLGEADDTSDNDSSQGDDDARLGSDSGKSGITAPEKNRTSSDEPAKKSKKPNGLPNGVGTTPGKLSAPQKREPGAPKSPAPVPMLKMGDETPMYASEPLIDEIASCLREWHSTNLHELLLSRQYTKLDKLSQLVQGLDLARRQLLHNVLTTHETTVLREKTVWDLVRGNKLCGGEVIVRDPQEHGRVLTGEDPVVEITKLQSMMSLLDDPPQPQVELTALHHLLVDVRSFAGSGNEPTTLTLCLVSKVPGSAPKTLSEGFSIAVPPGGTMGHLDRSRMHTLFTDLTSTDIGDTPSAESDLYLVIKARTPQQIALGKPGSRSGTSHAPPSPGYSKDKPPSSSGNKTSRRSLMWGSTRTAFSRGGTKLDALSEQPEERSRNDSRDGPLPPTTAGSKHPRSSIDGLQPMHVTAERLAGIGILKLNAIMKQEEETEHVVSIWSPSENLGAERLEAEEEHDDIIRELMVSKSGRFEKSRRAERLQVQLRSFNNPDADALIKATPTMLSGIARTNKMGFSGAPTKPRSDIYVTISDALVGRQNLISRYGGSATSISNNMHGTNLVVTVEVRRPSGERIENCIYPSSNSEHLSSWKSFAVERGEPWNQTLRLSILPPDVSSSHVVFWVADLPNPPFAIAHMPLWDQQAFVKDGMHSLLLYKLDENTQTAQAGPTGKGGYLSVPWATRGDPSEVTGPLATLRIDSYLCSTRFSQDRSILGLLKWKEYSKEDLHRLLQELVFVPEIEIVKLISDVLDALFGILVEYQENDDYEDLVFTVLVRVLGIVHDRRFNLGPLVDHYAETKFNYPFATTCLVRSFTRLLSKPSEPETARKLRATFKVVRHILKFITQGRGQQKVKEEGIGITGNSPGFTRHLQSIFKALDSMMRSTSPVLVGSQTLAVQHFHTWLPELAGLLTPEEILHIAIDFMDSCSLVKGKLVLYKLVLIINYSKLDVFSHPEQRSALSANTVRWIAPHWGAVEEVTEQWKDQVRLCCSIIAGQIDHLGNEIPDYVPKIVESYLAIQATELTPKSRFSLLFPSAYPFPSKLVEGEAVRFDEALIELSAVLSALSTSPNGMQLELVEGDLTTVVENTLHVHMSILQGEAFPPSWLSVHIFHHKSTMRTLQYLANILLESFLPDPDDAEDFNTELWKMFFTTMLKLVGSDCLALETFPEQKRRAVWKIAGDVREHGADLLRRTWEAIGWETSSDERTKYGLTKMGGYQVQYVPTLVGPIVELCLSVHEGLRTMAVEILQTMIVSEWTLSEDLSVIQMEMIDSLDLFFKDKSMSESILQKRFIGELLDRFEPLSHVEDEPLYAALTQMVNTVGEFLDLLVAVHSSDVTGQASHLINRLRLMEFLRDMQKEEIFIRYVHQLAGLQSDARNFTEAGLALRLHADLYEWNPSKTLQPLLEPDLPSQSEFERKEHIYFEMIQRFEDGEAWSSALAAYKELQVQYETNTFEFVKLARTEKSIASIYEKLTKSDKPVPKYFKVVYKGLGFTPNLRGKEFVHEGSPTERTSAFTDRMQEQYPNAHIITGGDVDDEAEGQYLVISSISPHRDLNHHVFQRAKVPQPIREYLLSAHPQIFSVSTKRTTTGPVEEHHAEKMVYETYEPFPTILRRSEIVNVHEVRLNAKETGLERIVRKTQEMVAVEKRLVDGDDDVAQLLVDAVSISVNPNSDNSVVCYRQLIPEPDPEEEEEVELDPQENAIRVALIDHAMMLKRCLMYFSRSSNDVLKRGYDELYGHFEATYAPEIAVFTPVQPIRDTSSTHSPTWRRQSPMGEMSPVSPHQHGPSISNGIAIEQASAAQPISVRQRGTRLSFLGGKKKNSIDSTAATSDAATTSLVNGETETASQPNHVKENRRSFFRTHPNEASPISGPFSLERKGSIATDRKGSTTSDRKGSIGTDRKGSVGTDRLGSVTTDRKGSIATNPTTPDWPHDYQPRKSSDLSMLEKNNERVAEIPVSKTGSVRKRLSMLKLGRKSSRPNGIMAGVDEE